MPPKESVTSEDNVKLLVAAIKSLSGKIDWQRVAEECNITSAGAAAKRYDRLLKANGITKAANNDQAKKLHGAGGSDDDTAAGTSEQESPKKRKAAAAGKGRGKGSTKKIKVKEQTEVGDEDEAEVEC